MKITAEERLMYNVMKAIYESGIPISFKYTQCAVLLQSKCQTAGPKYADLEEDAAALTEDIE